MTAYQTIDVAPVAGALGAEISGVDLRQPLGEAQRVDIREALTRHLVVFFRDQLLTEDEHLRFASIFGDLYQSSTNPDEPGSLFTTLEDTPNSPPKADRWHTDVSFSPRPPDVAVLQMLAQPAGLSSEPRDEPLRRLRGPLPHDAAPVRCARRRPRPRDHG